MKILVTGGAGFIGSCVIRHIINNSLDSVINVDKLTYAGNLESLSTIDKSSRYTFEHIDICNRNELKRVFNEHKPTAVMHLAAESHVDRSINESISFIETNIIGTYALLEVCRDYYTHLDKKLQKTFRFHHISTDEVYGDLNNSDDFFTETTPYAPSSPYSASKASSDHLVRAWYRSYGLPILITNCSNNYGPYQFPEKLIPLTILNAINGKSLPIYGKGNQIRDWLYVEDHARALYAVLTKGKIGETYNIGGLNEKQNIEVVKSICELLEDSASEKKSKNIEQFSDLINHIKDRPGHDQRYAINAIKIENELGWKPLESFESGLSKTVNWYLENTQWTNNVHSGEYRDWITNHYNQ